MLWTDTGPKGTSFRSSTMRNGKAAFFCPFYYRPQLIFVLTKGHVRASTGVLAVHDALIERFSNRIFDSVQKGPGRKSYRKFG